jgi:hypothetical protein
LGKKFRKYILKFFSEAKKSKKCISKYLFKGKKKDWGYTRIIGVGREKFLVLGNFRMTGEE